MILPNAHIVKFKHPIYNEDTIEYLLRVLKEQNCRCFIRPDVFIAETIFRPRVSYATIQVDNHGELCLQLTNPDLQNQAVQTLERVLSHFSVESCRWLPKDSRQKLDLLLLTVKDAETEEMPGRMALDMETIKKLSGVPANPFKYQVNTFASEQLEAIRNKIIRTCGQWNAAIDKIDEEMKKISDKIGAKFYLM